MACMKSNFTEGSVLDGRYQCISPLNHGSFGMVFLAKDLTSENHVAIKCLTKSPITSGPLPLGSDHLVELACHNRLGHHPNIVNLVDAFETATHMFLVLEFCSMGDLYEAIRLGRGPLETEHVRSFMLQLIDAVDFMHSKGLYHRDIKPENIFLAQDGSMKLGDFGLSTTEPWTYEASVGSDRYMAPEQYDPANEGYSPPQADIWAIGICLLNILFSRNPFIAPTESDVIFADFVRDKQSLFDVFPNMSQDTFDVLVHALAIDPKRRSMSAVRNAINSVLSFTTDDEIFDDFCTENKEVVLASANRQPLRTPSIQSPPMEQGGAFPWAKALQFDTSRQLSVIEDTEGYADDLFPTSDKSSIPWYSSDPANASLASVLDSALGASVKSMTLRESKPRNPPRAQVVPMSGSLPVNVFKPVPAMSSVFGKEAMSKSWSDLWEEDEEEELEDVRRKLNARNWSSESIDQDVTIRPIGLSEPKGLSFINTRTRSPARVSPGMVGGSSCDTTGSFEHIGNASYKLPLYSPVYSPPPKRSVLDKWAALGNRRRAFVSDKDEKEEPASKRTNTGWRSGFGFKAFSGNMGGAGGAKTGAGLGVGGIWERKERDRDIPGGIKVRDWRRDQGHRSSFYGLNPAAEDQHQQRQEHDDADIEWIGGWHDLHV